MTAVHCQSKSLRVRALVRHVFGALTLLACASAGAQVVTMKYVVNNLGNLKSVDGASVQALGLNEAGQVVGQSINAIDATHAFRTAPNRAIQSTDDLGTLGGSFSSAYGINNASQVAGDADTALAGPFGSVVRRAFRLDPGGSMIDLGTLAPNGGANGFNNSGARGINDAGNVVGFATVPADTCGSSSHAFRTAPNASIVYSPFPPYGDDLGTLVPPTLTTVNCRSSMAWAVNSAGDAVGDSATTLSTGLPRHAFRTAPLVYRTDLGTLGGRGNSAAFAINDLGESVGESAVALDPAGNPFDSPHAFISMGSLVPRTIDIGTLGGGYSSAAGINYRYPDDSQVVGSATTSGNAALHAFLWTGNVFNGGTMVDLNTRIAAGSGWELVGAKAINNKGQIIGAAWKNGVRFVGYAVRLDPSDVAVSVLIGTLSDAQYGLSAGQINSLTDKLTSAYNSIRAGLFKQATNQLNANINAVQVQVQNGKMSVATANALIAAINAIIVTLQ